MAWIDLSNEQQEEYKQLWIETGVPEAKGISDYNEANP